MTRFAFVLLPLLASATPASAIFHDRLPDAPAAVSGALPWVPDGVTAPAWPMADNADHGVGAPVDAAFQGERDDAPPID